MANLQKVAEAVQLIMHTMRGRRNDIGSLDTARRPGAMAIQRKFVAMANIHPLAQALEDKVVNPVHRQFRL